MLERTLPFHNSRQIILDHPTPLQQLKHLETALGRKGLYIKRDDHMEIALGGNKLRSLEFWVGAAMDEGADVLLVAGGAMSNLCRLTAAAAAMHGLDCVIFHNAEISATAEKQSFLNRIFGAELRFIGNVSEEHRATIVTEAAEDMRLAGRKPYIVGDAILGALGYAAAAYELYAQSVSQDAAIRHVFLSGSMGPTEAGFIFGNALLGNPFAVHLVSVEYGQAELAARVARIYDGLRDNTGLQVAAFDELPVYYHMDYLGDGYGQPTKKAEEALLLLARSEGILTEYVYTAKTAAAFIELSENGYIAQDEASCFLHTGGVPSLFSQFDLFKSLP